MSHTHSQIATLRCLLYPNLRSRYSCPEPPVLASRLNHMWLNQSLETPDRIGVGSTGLSFGVRQGSCFQLVHHFVGKPVGQFNLNLSHLGHRISKRYLRMIPHHRLVTLHPGPLHPQLLIDDTVRSLVRVERTRGIIRVKTLHVQGITPFGNV